MSGVGGLEQVSPYLDDSKLQWIGFRVTVVDEIKKDDGTLSTSLRPKFIVVTWLGPSMPPIQRAKFRESGALIMKQFKNTVIQVRLRGVLNVTPTTVFAQQAIASSSPYAQSCTYY